MKNFIYFEKINSTQKYLIEKIKKGELNPPVCVWSELQTDGIGSKNNKWIGKKGNLFFSFAYKKEIFKNVPLQSLSIYFGWIFKKTLNELGSKAIMKWPNDIYLIKTKNPQPLNPSTPQPLDCIDKKPLKIGGVITNLIKSDIVCGIGLNTRFAPSKEFGSLDIVIKNGKILKRFFLNLEKRIDFNNIIDEFNVEFEKYKSLFSIDAVLAKDGSLQNNQKRIYSKR